MHLRSGGTDAREREIQARDKASGSYEDWYLQHKGYWFDWLEKRVIIEQVNPLEDEVVLDAGCGTGRLTRELARRCRKVYALDFSARSIEFLRKKTRETEIHNVQSLVWDLTQPFPLEEMMDKVVSCQVVQHIPTKHLRHQALQNMYDQLRDGGTLVITFYSWVWPSKRKMSKEGEWRGGLYYSRFTPEEAQAALYECGFKNVSIGGFMNLQIYQHYFMTGDKHSIISHFIARGDLFLSRFGLSRHFGGYLVCKATK